MSTGRLSCVRGTSAHLPKLVKNKDITPFHPLSRASLLLSSDCPFSPPLLPRDVLYSYFDEQSGCFSSVNPPHRNPNKTYRTQSEEQAWLPSKTSSRTPRFLALCKNLTEKFLRKNAAHS